MPRQLTFDLFSEPTSAYSPAIAAALAALSAHGDGEARGAVFTRVEVVEFILDLVGYTVDQPLHQRRLLEPSCGGGDFLLLAVERLLAAWRVSGGEEDASAALGNAIRAVELHHETFAATRRKLSDKLLAEGLARHTVDELVERWLVQGDFLLEPIDGEFDYVVGNPPYVRQEQLRGKEGSGRAGAVREVSCIPLRDEPWLFDATEQTALLRRLELAYPTLEEAGCKVGIGVATGADQAFIGDYEALDVEDDRKLPLATTRDIQSGAVQWQGQGVINPFADDGGLVELRDYPRLGRYLEARRELIANRHCARKNPGNWYRTIDRITPALATTPKLLIPDIKGAAHIVFEPGQLYPHHNLYHVTSAHWDLHALQAVLLSDVTRLLVAAYSTRMRGGYLRFQAQYLRRIRIPHWMDVPAALRQELPAAALERDFLACNRAAHKLFGLSREELLLLEGIEI